MPLVFIHGVCTRSTDEVYPRAVAARKEMFEHLVVPTVGKRGFPRFSVANDIYWGDLGVNFAWDLRSIPETKVLQSLGATPAVEQNLDIVQLMLGTQSSPTAVEQLGAESPLVIAAQKAPGAMVRAIFAPEADLFAPQDLR